MSMPATVSVRAFPQQIQTIRCTLERILGRFTCFAGHLAIDRNFVFLYACSLVVSRNKILNLSVKLAGRRTLFAELKHCLRIGRLAKINAVSPFGRWVVTYSLVNFNFHDHRPVKIHQPLWDPMSVRLGNVARRVSLSDFCSSQIGTRPVWTVQWRPLHRTLSPCNPWASEQFYFSGSKYWPEGYSVDYLITGKFANYTAVPHDSRWVEHGMEPGTDFAP